MQRLGIFTSKTHGHLLPHPHFSSVVPLSSLCQLPSECLCRNRLVHFIHHGFGLTAPIHNRVRLPLRAWRVWREILFSRPLHSRPQRTSGSPGRKEENTEPVMLVSAHGLSSLHQFPPERFCRNRLVQFIHHGFGLIIPFLLRSHFLPFR